MSDAELPAETHHPYGRVLVAVCTLNEAENIGPLLRRLRSALPFADILVVDDNSPDCTAAIVEKEARSLGSIELVLRTNERGLGSAICVAMNRAISGRYRFVLNLDADFSHDPDQLPRLLERADQNPPADVVIGSRYVEGGEIVGWPLRRRVMSRIVNAFATRCLRLPVRDCSGSMRCYRVETLSGVELSKLRSAGYAVLEELLVRLAQSGAVFVEIPITFTDRQHGQSKLTGAESLRSAGEIVRLALRR